MQLINKFPKTCYLIIFSVTDYYMTDSNNAPYICPCSKAYKYKRNLLAHQKYSCGGRGLNKNFKCSLCYYETNIKGNLVRHLRKIHKRPTPSNQSYNQNHYRNINVLPTWHHQ